MNQAEKRVNLVARSYFIKTSLLYFSKSLLVLVVLSFDATHNKRFARNIAGLESNKLQTTDCTAYS